MGIAKVIEGFTLVATGMRRIFSVQARDGRIGKGVEESRGKGLNLFYRQMMVSKLSIMIYA